ncbi:hypothetical protein BOTCAL_0052g00120 [Botryotinia calthae]|uniref:Uncharacterized protein n=1 Tax=Botryotinia calthae TaxID=38488 RepID=A0A4Y8DDF6_9HELO|nr:hypothetical protein BOTCAL_0052g00120 [Botryotinia calthae]
MLGTGTAKQSVPAPREETDWILVHLSIVYFQEILMFLSPDFEKGPQWTSKGSKRVVDSKLALFMQETMELRILHQRRETMKTSKPRFYEDELLGMKNEVLLASKVHEQVLALATVSEAVSVPSKENESMSYLGFRTKLSQVSFVDPRRKPAHA